MRNACLALGLCLLAAVSSFAAPSMVIRNNYDMPYAGPVTFRTSLPDGYYAGKGAAGSVRAGVGYVGVRLPAKSRVGLQRVAARRSLTVIKPDPKIILSVGDGVISLRRGGEVIGEVNFGLSIIDGRTGTADEAVSSFEPMGISMKRAADGSVSGSAETRGYRVKLTTMAIGGSWIDVSADVTNLSGGNSAAYVALVRRVRTTGITNPRMRWNGRIVDGTDEPSDYAGSYNYCHCVDWCSWKAGGLSFAVANGFTPGLSAEQTPGRWANAGHPYVWEHVRKEGPSTSSAPSTSSGCLYFVSEVAGPDPSQKPGYKGIKAYVPPRKGEPVKLHWRLAITSKPEPTWEESQFLVSAGYRRVTYDASARKASDRSISDRSICVDLGVPYVEFGTSYFTYSTMTENFDFYRTPGLDREGWWPFSAKMWENWRAFAPQMKTDLRIIRAMGFEWVRMHHLELIAGMDRKNAMNFIDFYMNECRKLGLKVLIDTSGSPQWFATLAGRYKDVAKRIEIENEVLIPGIKPGDPERWKACYKAAKQAAPGSDVFLTGNANLGMFDRLTRLGVPYDRLGYHTYKHGPGAEETLSSLAVAVAGVAADRGTTPVLSEFNWKMLTRLSPEARAKEWALIFGDLLKSRAVPELLQFHWQETMSVNPLLCRQGIRHYETIYLDRRPKPEAFELMKLIRQYCRADAPVRELPIRINPLVFTEFMGNAARTEFTVTNATARTLTVKLTPECFSGSVAIRGLAKGDITMAEGGVVCRLVSPGMIVLKPGTTAKGTVEISFKPNWSLPGVYHFFIKAAYSALRQAQDAKTAYGWGYASKPGIPWFDAKPVMPDLVKHSGLYGEIGPFDWRGLACVAFGPDAPVVEMEMAYVVANTLQSATGREIRLCSTADIPADMLKNGSLILVGTPESNPLIESQSSGLNFSDGKGEITIFAKFNDGGRNRQWLLLTGNSSKAVEAVATDFVLRYWKNAKDSAIRVTGMEKGAALGNRAAPGQVNPP